MKMNSVSMNTGIEAFSNNVNKQKLTPYESQKNFSSFLKDAIGNTNLRQVESDLLTQKLINGENVELHEVMIAAQKASITLNTTMEVRNKVVEAYQEIIRMPL